MPFFQMCLDYGKTEFVHLLGIIDNARYSYSDLERGVSPCRLKVRLCVRAVYKEKGSKVRQNGINSGL